MAERHFTRALFEALRRGRGAGQELVRRTAEHLLEICPHCRREYEMMIAEDRESSATPSHDGLAGRLLADLDHRLEVLDRHRDKAQKEFKAIARLPRSARRMKIARALTRFRSPFLVDLLLEESRERAAADPFAALDFADCAHEVSLRVASAEFGNAWCMTQIARAHAYRGNALRATGDLLGAEPPLETAQRIFDDRGNGDPLVGAELAGLLGSLRMDQQRLTEAEQSLERAIALYRRHGLPSEMARQLVKRATLYNSGLGDTRRAVATLQEAIAAIDPERDTRLYLHARHNLIVYLHDLGRDEQARELVAETASLYQRFPDPWTQLRLRWVEGKIARGLGELDEAAAILAGVRDGFFSAGLGFDAALASLDLALVYVEREDTRALAELTEELVPVFTAQESHREAIAALLLLQKAALRNAVTRSTVEKVIRSLERARGTGQS